jgi:hypothetical protein
MKNPATPFPAGDMFSIIFFLRYPWNRRLAEYKLSFCQAIP